MYYTLFHGKVQEKDCKQKAVGFFPPAFCLVYRAAAAQPSHTAAPADQESDSRSAGNNSRIRRESECVQLPFYSVQCPEKAMCCNGRAEQQKPCRIPAEHMPPGRVRSLDPEFFRLFLQFLRYSGHPHKRIDECGRYPQDICLPVGHHRMTEDGLDLILQAAQRHVDQEEKPRSAKIDQPEQKTRPVRMPECHRLIPRVGAVFIDVGCFSFTCHVF